MAQFGAPNFLKAIDAYEAGADRAEKSRLRDLAERGRQLSGEVLAGNRNKLGELYANNPEMGMKVEQFTDQKKKAWIENFTREAYGATTPQAWKAMIDRHRAEGRQFAPGEDDFANRDALIARGLEVGDMMGLDLRRQELNKPTQDLREYEYARSQGFKGSFLDYQTGLKQAGANKSVNILNAPAKGETKYQEEIGSQLAKRWGSLAEEGDAAQEELTIVGQLRNALPQNGGLLTGIAGMAAEWGIGGEGMSDIQVTQSLVDRLTPKQRVPGSGTSSDLDVKMFKSGMPSLWRTPEGNAVIMDTMESLALYRQARGQIAYQVMDGAMTRQQAVEAFKKLPDPFATFKAYRKRAPAGQDRRAPNAQPQNGAKGDMAPGKANPQFGTTRSGNQFRLVQ